MKNCIKFAMKKRIGILLGKD